jgi:hypothetical protein
MLTTSELVIQFAALALLPLAVFAFLRRGTILQHPNSVHYRAQRFLFEATNLPVFVLGLIAVLRLSVHFGLVRAETAYRVDPWLWVALGVLVLASLALWALAFRKIRRQRAMT